jgi:hypothetical protein
VGAGLRYLDNKELQKVKDGVSGNCILRMRNWCVFEFGINQSRQGKVGCCQEQVGKAEKGDRLASNGVLRGIDDR